TGATPHEGGNRMPLGSPEYRIVRNWIANGAKLEVPANLPSATVKEIQNLAIKSFKVLCCEGLARVDFFLTDSGKLFVNEINTLPGFTRISMYPKMWQASGLSYPDLIDKLLTFALERAEKSRRLKTTF
ncbi:MAG: D-alanine--D-alanine ligase A, partial [Bdellovibrionia bacterium]